jgi:hypothetical protein
MSNFTEEDSDMVKKATQGLGSSLPRAEAGRERGSRRVLDGGCGAGRSCGGSLPIMGGDGPSPSPRPGLPALVFPVFGVGGGW